MSTLRHLGNFWILWVTTMVLACFSNAVAQASYKVKDLGVQTVTTIWVVPWASIITAGR